jgi:hypothetical protein
VAATGSWLSIHTATTAAALTLVGLLASHVHDLGRVAEYRQTFNAAKRMIGPALPPATPAEPATQRRRGPTAADPDPDRTGPRLNRLTPLSSPCEYPASVSK